MARLRHADGDSKRLLIGEDRKSPAHSQNDAIDPGCVKTCTSQECAELFSQSSSLSSGRKHFWFSNFRNRDGISTRRLNVGVFTRPRPTADIGVGLTHLAGMGLQKFAQADRSFSATPLGNQAGED